MLHQDNMKNEKYKVMVDNRTLTVATSPSLAEQFIMNLPPEDQIKARIVPVLTENSQLLLEK